MKWGRKKSASLISRVFPISWLSKFRGKCVTSELTSARKKHKGKWDLPSQSCKQGSFCSTDYDHYSRISYGEERIQGRMSTGGINCLLYDSDDDMQAPIQGIQSFDDTVLDIKRMKEKQHYRETEFITRRRKPENDRRSNRRVLKDIRAELERGFDKEKETSSTKDIFETQPEIIMQKKDKNFHKSTSSNARKQHSFYFPNSHLSTIEEDCSIWALNLEERTANSKKKSSPHWQTLKDKKIKEMAVDCRVKALTPNTECKIQALSDMKKSRVKLEKKAKEKIVEVEAEEGTVFDSFAVVKSSFDPRQDFRDSMVEMITKKQIRRPKELEELLACYLTMNSDEYHDLIIKVFRQVWLDLHPMYIDPAIQNDHCFDDY